MTTIAANRVRSRLRIVQWIALVDAVLLVSSVVVGARSVVHILGPLHGVNFLLLVVVAATAAIDGLWGWWFPLLILVTAGPVDAFIGERIILRRIALPHSAVAPVPRSGAREARR